MSPPPLRPQSAFNGLSALVSVDWLHRNLPSVTVIDASWYMPSLSRNAHADHKAAHIPGAVFLDIDAPDVKHPTSPLPHMLPDVPTFSKAARRLAIRRDVPAIVYSNSPFVASARVWWMLRALGKTDVYVLDGGLPLWISEGHPTHSHPSAQPSAPPPASDHHPFRLDDTLVRSLPQMLDQIRANDGVIIDARPADRFHARVPEPRPGIQAGHMPHAINVPVSEVLASDGRMKPVAELRAAFQRSGLDLDRCLREDVLISCTCGSGVTAGVLALALHEIGVKAAVYDGSWTEYGANPTHPVVSA